MTQAAHASTFAMLAGHNYINLTTFRKNGQPVITPVWFAQDGDRLYITTVEDTGKVKRIRNTSRVQIGPSDARGRPRGPVIEARGRVLPPVEHAKAERALDQKYGWQKRAFEVLSKLVGLVRRSRLQSATTYLEITPSDA